MTMSRACLQWNYTFCSKEWSNG